MTAIAETATEWLPLDTIALSAAPNRQIRDVRERDVLDLMETDPAGWDAILVRPWPEGEDYPLGEEGRHYQVVAGYHRVSAARRMKMPRGIKAIVRNDLTDDKAFLLVALASNLRHGAKMERADIIAQVKRLRDDLGMSVGEIAKSLSLPKGTVANWVSGRDTNAGRSSRDATGERSSAVKSLGGSSKAWSVAPTANLTPRQAQVVDDAIMEALAADPSATLAPADVLAWAAQLQPARRQMLKGVAQIAAFWEQVRRIVAGEGEA